MEYFKSASRFLYEELRLLSKDSFEAILRLKKICVNDNTQYIFINDHIGDVIISLGYLRAFREKNHLNHITVIVTEKFRGIVDKYSSDYEDVIYLSEHELYRILLLNLTRYGQYVLHKKHSNVTFVNPADLSLLGFEYFKRFPELSFEKLIKYGDLRLDVNSKFISIIEKNMNLLSFCPNKKVLFSANARTEAGDVIPICKELVKFFSDMKYDLYTNTEHKEECIEGTKPIFLRLEDLGSFISGGIFIGLRSGIHDLLAYYGCMMVALYSSQNCNDSFFSLGMLPKITSKYLELVISEDINNDCKKVIDFLKESEKAL